MIHSGLVSVTFTRLSPEEVVRLVTLAGLEAIEWHGLAHVPHGDTDAARRVARLTIDAGLRVAAYGSYYHVGEPNGFRFDQVVETAALLGAPTIRVWAGHRPSAQADGTYREKVVSESRQLADMAAAEGMTISYEYHGDSLTDTDASALQLLREVNHPAVRSYWQPHLNDTPEQLLTGLRDVLPWLSNVHVFHWHPGTERKPLAEGADQWMQYLRTVSAGGGDHSAMIEFVMHDSTDTFLQDAVTLKTWLSSI